MGPMRRTRALFKRGGTEFVNAYATTPLCCPSRASILTGRYAHNHRVRTNADAHELDPKSTLQRYLGDAGYRTGIVGKYLNSWTGRPSLFEQWHTFENVAKYRGARFNSNGVVHKVKKYSTDYIGDRARGLLRQFEATDSKPWFLVVATWAPHTPAQAAKRHRKSKVGKWAGTPAVLEAARGDKPAYGQAKSAGFKGGRRLAATIDVAPTVLQAAGITPDPEYPLDGRSLLQPSTRERLLLELTGGNNQIDAPTWSSTLTPSYQYIEYYDDVSGEVTFREYYDLVNDPYQLENLLADPDPANDPPIDEQANLRLRLSRDRACQGTDGLVPCP